MANKNKNVVINISPYNAEMKSRSDGSFYIEFSASIGDSYARRKIVRVHFDRWWIRVLARLLWKHIRHEESEVSALREKMLNDE